MSTDLIFPNLETERLTLRPIANSDLEFIYQHFSDKDVNRYLLDEDPVTSLQEAQEIIDFYLPTAGKPYNRWVITLKSSARPIGTCGYHKWQRRHHHAEIGYDLAKEFWRQGYMVEALRSMLSFGFTVMDLNRIEASVYPQNIASLQLLERLGFLKEGLCRESIFQGGKYHDHWLLSLLKTDWLASLK